MDSKYKTFVIMKKTIRTFILLMLSFTAGYGQIGLNQRISDMTLFLLKDKLSLVKYLNHAGYTFVNKHDNFSQYKKGSQFSYTFTFSEKNSLITALSWTEFLGNYQLIINELQGMGFESKNSASYNSGVALSFINQKQNIVVTLMTRNDLNDFIISLGATERNYGSKIQTSAKATNSPKVKRLNKESYTINLPPPPLMIPRTSIRSLASEGFVPKNGTQEGIIHKVFKDADDDVWITICFQDKLNQTPYKGVILMDVNTSEYFFPENLSKLNSEYFKKIIARGRPIVFQTETVGSGALSHAALVFIKPSVDHPKWNSKVIIEKHIK